MYCANWMSASIDSVLGSSFDMELPKRGPKSSLNMIERDISGENHMPMKYLFLKEVGEAPAVTVAP